MAKGSLIKGTLIMASSGLLIKLIGFLFKIVLARVIGSEGYGIYTIAYSLYSPLLMLFVSGIPVAISQLSAADSALKGKKSPQIFSTMLFFNSFFGLLLAGLFFLLIKPIANGVLNDPQVIPALMGITPAIFFAAMLAVFRGYFQGLQQMSPTAVSQMAEQVIRVSSSLVMIIFLLKSGPAWGALGVTLAAGVGGFAGLLVLIGYYITWRRQKKIPSPSGHWFQWKIVQKIMQLAVPITIGALAISLMQFLDGTIIPRRLVAMGFLRDEARAIFGGFGMANSLTTFPTILATAISVNLIPAIARSSLQSPKLTTYRIGQAIRWGGIISFPAVIGLFLLAGPITKLIYGTGLVEVPLKVLCWSIAIISLHTITTGIIQGLGKTYLPAKYLLIGGLVNGVINYTLTPIFGIRGAAFGTIIGYLISLGGNLRELTKLTGFRRFWQISLPAILAAFSMGVVVLIVNYWANQLALINQVIITVVSGVCSYLIFLILYKGISIREIKSFFEK